MESLRALGVSLRGGGSSRERVALLGVHSGSDRRGSPGIREDTRAHDRMTSRGHTLGRAGSDQAVPSRAKPSVSEVLSPLGEAVPEVLCHFLSPRGPSSKGCERPGGEPSMWTGRASWVEGQGSCGVTNGHCCCALNRHSRLVC